MTIADHDQAAFERTNQALDRLQQQIHTKEDPTPTPRQPSPPARAARRRRQTRSRAFDCARWSLRRLDDATIEPEAKIADRKFIRGLNLIPRFRGLL